MISNITSMTHGNALGLPFLPPVFWRFGGRSSPAPGAFALAMI
jgi:hypothetical protein